MIRRAVLAATALAVLGGFAAPALASTNDSDDRGEHGFCVGLGQTHGGPINGVCVWVPTD